MANGDLLTLDYQWQLHDILYGCGEQGLSIENNKSVDGLGPPPVKSQDVALNFGAGSIGNPDYAGVRVITIPAIVKATTPDAVGLYLAALNDTWIATVADTDLAFQLPGWGKFMVMGRPRGATTDTSLINRGSTRILLRFDALDPTITAL